nr:MAG TPA: hypothetical protein [Caudoviricetes sp.]
MLSWSFLSINSVSIHTSTSRSFLHYEMLIHL